MTEQMMLFEEDDNDIKDNVLMQKAMDNLKQYRYSPSELPHLIGAVNPGDPVVSMATQISNMIQLRKLEDENGDAYQDYTSIIEKLQKRLEDSIEYTLKMPSANIN